MKRLFTQQDEAIEIKGPPSDPYEVPIPSMFPVEHFSTEPKQGRHYVRGENVEFYVPKIEQDSEVKITVGWVMNDENPIHEKLISGPHEGGFVAVLNGVQTVALPSGMYLWDVWLKEPNKDARMVGCGSFHLRETTGSSRFDEDPSIVEDI
jgi:hypothetical protein